MGNKHSGNRSGKSRAKGAGRKSLPVSKRMARITITLSRAQLRWVDESKASRSRVIQELIDRDRRFPSYPPFRTKLEQT